MSSQSQRIQASSLTKECEILFLQSLSFIHLDGLSHMRRRGSLSHDVCGNKIDGEWIHKKIAGGPRPTRRATETDLGTPVSHQDLDLRHGISPFKKDRTFNQDVVRNPGTNEERDLLLQDSNIPQASKPLVHHNVSFCQNKDVTIKQSSPNCTVPSLPTQSCTAHPTDVAESNSICNSFTEPIQESKAGPSVNWSPPPPPRPSSRKPNFKTRKLSLMLPSAHQVPLPFSTTETSFPSGPRPPSRKYNTLEQDEINQVQQQQNQNMVKSHTAVSSPPQFSLRRRSENDYQDRNTCEQHFLGKKKEENHCSFRKDYTLGETARSPSHMVIEPCPKKAGENAAQLKNYDFAFVKRTNGSWTYSILAYRSFIGCMELNELPDECMLFVTSYEGSTKWIKKRQWAGFVRLVAVHGDLAKMGGNTNGQEIATGHRRQLRNNNSRVPDIISIEREKDDDSQTSVSV